MQYLTFAFYEYPAAKPHILMWENLMRDQKRIISKEEFFDDTLFVDSNEITYKVKRGNEIETLICIPFQKLEKYRYYVLPENTVYLKTLIFGKITQEQLELLAKCNFEENFFKTRKTE